MSTTSAEKAHTAKDPGDELDQRIGRYLRWGLPIAAIGTAAIAGAVQGPSTAIMVLAGGTLVAVIAIFWSSVRTLVGETPLSGADAYALAAPRAEEEQKRAVLRALKDLEFERSVGKISEDDYHALVTKYRTEAKRLLRQIDEEAGPRRAQVEALVAKRLRREGLADAGYREAVNDPGPEDAEAKSADATEGEVKAPAKGKKRKKGRAGEKAAAVEAKSSAEAKADGDGAPRACEGCGTMNDADAVFCKKCGARQEKAAATASDEEAS